MTRGKSSIEIDSTQVDEYDPKMLAMLELI